MAIFDCGRPFVKPFYCNINGLKTGGDGSHDKTPEIGAASRQYWMAVADKTTPGERLEVARLA